MGERPLIAAGHNLTGITRGHRGPHAHGASTDRAHAVRRLTTETKISYKTEFIAYLVVLVGILIAGNSIEGKDGGADYFAGDKVWLYATILTVAAALKNRTRASPPTDHRKRPPARPRRRAREGAPAP